MLIGMRNAMLAGGGWKNPYVTDGLIAMWDGEWNAGPGVHDAQIVKWKDIVGGLEFDNYGTGVSFQGNHIRISGTDSYLRRESSLVKPVIQGEGSSAYFAMELCVDADDRIADQSFARYVNIGGQISSYMYGLTFYTGSGGRFLTYWYVKNVGADKTLRTNVPRTFAIVSNGTVSTLYINGSKSSTLNNGSTTGWFNNWFIGGGPNGAMWSGKVYAHRFYSRALTAAEIAANYAVDKARFNLA